MDGRGRADADLDARRALSGLQELLSLSMLMFERHEVDHVLMMLPRSVRSIARCDLVRVRLHRPGGWACWPGPDVDIPDPGRFGSQPLIEPDGPAWLCTTAIAALAGPPGQLVLRSSEVPDAKQLVVIGHLAHLLGAALMDAELHEREHRRAFELERVNNELARAVVGLQEREAAVQVFAHLLVGGSDVDLVTALARLTGRTAVMRDAFGHETVRVRHEDAQAQPVHPTTTMSAHQLTRSESAVVATIGARPELGTIGLELSPDDDAEGASIPLQYAAIALAITKEHEQARARLENRLSRDLVEDLLEGIDAGTARARAVAQGHDLRVPHDVILVTWQGLGAPTNAGHDAGLDQVRRAVEHQRIPFLIARKPDVVVVIAQAGIDITKLYEDLSNGAERLKGQVAIGDPAHAPQDIPHAYAQARRALLAVQQAREPHGVAAYANLGVLRILAVEENSGEVDDLIDHWLDTLIRYDAKHSTDLVLTLAVYLDQGGSYDETAGALFIHRNTLRYRLRRITDISGHDISDVDTRLNLHLATRAWRLRKAGPGTAFAKRSP